MLKKTPRIVSFLLLLSPSLYAQSLQHLGKTEGDDNSKYTNVGNISITISNYGVVGHGFRLWPQQPSMQYPRGSGIEHMFVGGLWFGATTPNGIRVTTAAVDAGSVRAVAEGYEFTTGIESRVVERSSLADNRFYDPKAISHQDLIADFTDVNSTNPNQNNEPIPNHNPIGINVHLEAYAWNFSFADNFVLLNYWIKNVSGGPLDSVYVSFWADLVVRNTNITPPTVGTPFYNKGGLGYIDSLRLAYAYDYNGDGGLADTYGAMMFLGSTPFKNKTTYQSWQFRNGSDPVYFSPSTDDDKYTKMAIGLTATQIGLITKPSNNMTMLSMGPISHINAGDSVNIVFALIGAKKKSPSPPDDDSPAQKVNLLQAADWAQKTYNGEDRNGNGVQDSNEVWTNNGKPKRFFLPAPPNAPRIKVVPQNKLVDVYWDGSSEASVDPISNKKDFEGYRVYSTNAGVDLRGSQDLLSGLVLLGEFDRADDNIGYNTGFGRIKLGSPVQFLPDTMHYFYKFSVPGLLNGFQYAFAVTAFDSGDASADLASLESSKIQTLKRIVPGTPANTTFEKQVGVYPNPYYGKAYWDGTGERDRKLYFYNLPPRAEIRVYTLAGDLVDEFAHESATYVASDIRWFQKFSDGTQQLAGGEHAWDLISQRDQAIATGLYLFTVKNTDTGDIQRGKFLIIK